MKAFVLNMVVGTGLVDDRENNVFNADARNDLDEDDAEALVVEVLEMVVCPLMLLVIGAVVAC